MADYGRIGTGDGPLDGPPSKWVDTLMAFVLEHGMDTFIFWPSENHIQQTQLFANEIVPAVQEAVQETRT